jgi:hypothetical protein
LFHPPVFPKERIMSSRLSSRVSLTRVSLSRRCLPVCLWAAASLLAACGGGGGGSPTLSAAKPEPSKRPLAVSSPAAVVPGVQVDALELRAQRRISRTVFEYDYRVTLRNTGPLVMGVVARIGSTGPGTSVVDGVVDAGTLGAGATLTPADLVTVRHDRLMPFAPEQIGWQFSAAGGMVGTAAVGAALANANVSVTDLAGSPVCAEARVVTTGTGDFECTVLAGRTAPFVVVVTEPFGAYPPMVSIVPVAPAAGSTLVANATPLTTAIVGQLSPSGNALDVVGDPALIDLAALSRITANVMTQIAPVLSALNAAPAYDPFTTPIVAATPTRAGNTADLVVELLRFTVVNGVPQISVLGSPGFTVPLADANTVDPPVLPAVSSAALELAGSLNLFSQAYKSCFDLPVASRVLAVDTSIPAAQGGRLVTQMAPQCQQLAHPTYLSNGYVWGQRMVNLLQAGSMVGARFNLPEVMLVLDDTSLADNDRAVLNIRYVDANGVAGNLIEVVQKLPGTATATRPTDWWIYGNRDPVDSAVRSYVRRSEQRAPNPGVAPFANASNSRFESGIEVFINKDGPGSTDLRAARVRGPGLPPPGLVYTRPDPALISDGNWLTIKNKTGLTDPASAGFSNVSNIFMLHRTVGLTGVESITTRPNPNAGIGNSSQFVDWAHPLDYGAAVGTPTLAYIDFAALKAHNVYTIELFYVGETAPRHVINKRMLTPVTPATFAGNLEWLTLTESTVDLLRPAHPLAAPQSTVSLSWIANPFAETAASAGFYTFGAGQSISDAIIGVPSGATSATGFAPPGFQFPALTTDGSSSRTIQLRYRMLDGSYKDSIVRFN